MENPYQSPETSSQSEADPVQVPENMPGIGRAVFWGFVIVWRVTETLIVVALAESGISPVSAIVVTVGFLGVALIPVYYRLKNLGSNPMWCLLSFVPLINLLLFIRCMIFPTGYVLTKQLDTAAKLMIGLVGIVLVAVVILFVASGF